MKRRSVEGAPFVGGFSGHSGGFALTCTGTPGRRAAPNAVLEHSVFSGRNRRVLEPGKRAYFFRPDQGSYSVFCPHLGGLSMPGCPLFYL